MNVFCNIFFFLFSLRYGFIPEVIAFFIWRINCQPFAPTAWEYGDKDVLVRLFSNDGSNTDVNCHFNDNSRRTQPLAIYASGQFTEQGTAPDDIQ